MSEAGPSAYSHDSDYDPKEAVGEESEEDSDVKVVSKKNSSVSKGSVSSDPSPHGRVRRRNPLAAQSPRKNLAALAAAQPPVDKSTLRSKTHCSESSNKSTVQVKRPKNQHPTERIDNSHINFEAKGVQGYGKLPLCFWVRFFNENGTTPCCQLPKSMFFVYFTFHFIIYSPKFYDTLLSLSSSPTLPEISTRHHRRSPE